ncbi:unnamed protein product [Prunus brigantina]
MSRHVYDYGNSRMACKAKLMIPEDEKYEGKPNALSHARTAITTIKAKFNTQHSRGSRGVVLVIYY